MKAFLISLLIFICQPSIFSNELTDYLSDINCLVESESGVGTGCIINNGNDTYVLTASHLVVEEESHAIYLFDGDGLFLLFNEVPHTVIVSKLIWNEKSEIYNEVSSIADIETVNTNIDVALLKVVGSFSNKESLKFYKELKLPELTAEIWHMGNYGGVVGYGILSKGIYAKYNFHVNKHYADVGDLSLGAGCSGGGIFLTNKECVGIVTHNYGKNMCLFTPIREINKWLKDEGYEFLIYDSEKKAKSN